jgi:hypothetical protein
MATTTAGCPASWEDTKRSTTVRPARETGIDTGSASRPKPSLSQTRFDTLPGSTASTNVDGSNAVLQQRHEKPPP